MARRRDGQKRVIAKVLERMDWVFSELCSCQNDLDGCGCKALMKKLDTITGKVENLMNDLYDANGDWI